MKHIDENDDSIKMTPFMRLVKVGHDKVGNNDALSKLAAPSFGVKYNECTIKGIDALWVEPKKETETKRLIMYCHGGGFIAGGEGYASILAGKLALATGMKTLAYMYRLSPKDHYPAALEDTLSIWNSLPEAGYSAKDIIVAGESAGGNLVLELCLTLKSLNMDMPKALVLMSPWTDMAMKSKSYLKLKDADPILSKEYIEFARKAYLGERTDYTNPDYSPLYGNFESFPPVLIQVGSNEILLGDSTRLAYRMKRHNVNVRTEVYRGCWHAFQTTPLIAAHKAMQNINKFIGCV